MSTETCQISYYFVPSPVLYEECPVWNEQKYNSFLDKKKVASIHFTTYSKSFCNEKSASALLDKLSQKESGFSNKRRFRHVPFIVKPLGVRLLYMNVKGNEWDLSIIKQEAENQLNVSAYIGTHVYLRNLLNISQFIREMLYNFQGVSYRYVQLSNGKIYNVENLKYLPKYPDRPRPRPIADVLTTPFQILVKDEHGNVDILKQIISYLKETTVKLDYFFMEMNRVDCKVIQDYYATNNSNKLISDISRLPLCDNMYVRFSENPKRYCLYLAKIIMMLKEKDVGVVCVDDTSRTFTKDRGGDIPYRNTYMSNQINSLAINKSSMFLVGGAHLEGFFSLTKMIHPSVNLYYGRARVVCV